MALLPLLVSCAMLWSALLARGVLAPTDIVAREPLIANRLPGTPKVVVKNPLLGDVVDIFIPWRLYTRSELAAGRFPLWNPYNLLGTHFHANLQSQVFSPFNLLWLLLPPVWGLGAVAALKWTLCGLGMGLLLRRLGLGMAPAIFGSVALQLSGPVVGLLQWPITEVLAAVPWALWAALGWVDTRKVGWLAALAFLVAAMLLAGHIEASFHGLAFLSVFALAAGLTGGSGGRSRLAALAGLIGAGLLGLAMSAVALLPFFDVFTTSYQLAFRQQVQVHHISMPPLGGLMWLTPNGFGWPDAYDGPLNWIEANSYVGAITLLLAATNLGFWILDLGLRDRANPKSKILPSNEVKGQNPKSALSPRGRLFWGALLVVVLGMVFGIPPFSLIRELPGFNTDINFRLISVAGPCVIVLGAMGLDRLLSARNPRLPRWWVPAVAALVLAGGLFLSSGLQVWVASSRPFGAYMHAWRAWAGALFCVGAVLILARLLGWVRPRAFGALAIGVLLLDMMKADWGFNSTSAYETFYPPNKLLRFAAEHGPTQRLAVTGPYAEANLLMPYRVPDYRVYDPTYDNRYAAYTGMMSPKTYLTPDAAYPTHLLLVKPSAAYMAAVGIKWLLCSAKDDPNGWEQAPDGGPIYRLALAERSYAIWENLYARPYTSLASSFQVVSNEAIALLRMRALRLGSVNNVQIEDPVGTFPGDVAPQVQGNGESATLESYVPGEIKVKVLARARRFLVVNEGWSSGWRARVDGRPAEIYRTDYVVQGVVVPPGEHRVTLVYDPPAFRWGAGISAPAWLGWLVLVGFSTAVWVRHLTRSRAIH